MFIIYVINLSIAKTSKDGGLYFIKNKKYRPLEILKKKNLSYFVSEIPYFLYVRLFRKCSVFVGVFLWEENFHLEKLDLNVY